ncbi:MAG: hypothetical protein WA081_05435 [Desulfosalsimonadaceae bacterium]
MKNSKCLCCGWRPSAMAICFKPDDTVLKISLCCPCFDKYKINGDFLQTCLTGGSHEDFAKFKIRVDAESPQDMAA